jgi:hypothetical protein
MVVGLPHQFLIFATDFGFRATCMMLKGTEWLVFFSDLVNTLFNKLLALSI